MTAFIGNGLYILPNGLLDNLPRLVGADFSDNNLINSWDLEIQRSKEIQAISFHSNKMLEIKPLKNLNDLVSLMLQNNHISIIKSNTFVNLASLLINNLSENRINTVEWNSFVNVPKLKHLFLSNNRIVQMNGIFSANMSLTSL
ncbi:leucine-rich repeat-containing protein let-4-like [Actinia tenebrosa]|uniref:Leucine-rich repeat-containing protein let-4-like n=1 Tax=Actinia tenebrosa TaxID=6105 RepID=A0A6P8IVH4_ACTTE|nr:leucine-rich repeat-containing protein let-4-like [Actinia tenebrosa]